MPTIYEMKLLPELQAAIHAALTEDWQTAKQISKASGVSFQRVVTELLACARRGQAESKYQSIGRRGNQILLYRLKANKPLTDSKENASIDSRWKNNKDKDARTDTQTKQDGSDRQDRN